MRRGATRMKASVALLHGLRGPLEDIRHDLLIISTHEVSMTSSTPGIRH